MYHAFKWKPELERIHLSFPPLGGAGLFSHIDGKIRDGYGEDGCGRKVVGTERLILTQPYLWYETYHDVMVWRNLWKKTTPGKAAPGLEPWTSRM
jgi:hypothetical protein